MAFTCPPRLQLTVSSCQQPWPRSLAHCCFSKCIFKPPWLWDQPGNVPARGGSSQKAVWNYAPLCHMQRNTVATPPWSAFSTHHLFPTDSRYKVLLWRDGSSFGAPSCRVVTQHPHDLPGLLLLWGDHRPGGEKFWARDVFSHIFL